MATSKPENLYHAPAVSPPSREELKKISEELKLKCSDEELDAFHEEILHTLETSYKRVAEMVGPSLPVKYPRTPGYQPTAEENKYNAWYYKCEIKGAASGKLAGKRIGIKDNTAVAGVPMMNGSKLMEGYVPEFDATVVTRILDAGGTIVGKTHTEDLSLGGSSFFNVTGPVLNPHDMSRTSGGSSGGNAVLIQTGEIDMGVGGDQGGSIRIPATWCGIVGLKPTFGLVPYTGAVSIEMSCDHLGPMARTVSDCAKLLEVIAGYDEGRDPRQPPNIVVPEYSKQLTGDLKGKRVGLLTEGFDICEDDVKSIVREAALKLTKAGAKVEEVSIPMHKDGESIWAPICLEGLYMDMVKGNATGYNWKGFYPLSMQETLFRHYTSRPHDFSIVMKLVNVFCEYMSRNYQNKFYAKAQNLNILLTGAYNKALANYDVLVMPTCAYKASKLPKQDDPVKDKLKVALSMVGNTATFDVTGHPALTINAGFSEGLPVGMMIVGRHFDETSVLQVAYAFEQMRDA